MAEKDMNAIVNGLEQLVLSDMVGRLVNRAAQGHDPDGEKWVTATWLVNRLRRMGLRDVNRNDVGVLLDDLDVRRRRWDFRAGLVHLRELAQDGVLQAYTQELQTEFEIKARAANEIPVPIQAVIDPIDPPGVTEDLSEVVFPPESSKGVKTPINPVFAT